MAQSIEKEGRVKSTNDFGFKFEGSDDYYDYSKQSDPPHANRGETVRVKCSPKADGKWWVNSLEVVSGSSNGSTPNQAAYDNRQTSIERLACLKAAAEFLGRLSQTHEDVKSAHVTVLADQFVRWVQQEPDGE
jgi:hypothetical protein